MSLPDYDKTLLGNEGRGYIYKVEPSSDNEDCALAQDLWGLRISRDNDDVLSISSRSSVEEEHENEAEDERGESPLPEDVKCKKMFYIYLLITFFRHV